MTRPRPSGCSTRRSTATGSRSTGPTSRSGRSSEVVEYLKPYVELGYRHLIAGTPADYDEESMTRFATEVRPLLERLETVAPATVSAARRRRRVSRVPSSRIANRSDGSRRSATSRVGMISGRSTCQVRPSVDEHRLAGGENVPQPLRPAPVHEHDQEVVAVGDHAHGRLVGRPGPPATVADDRRERPGGAGAPHLARVELRLAEGDERTQHERRLRAHPDDERDDEEGQGEQRDPEDRRHDGERHA